MECLESANISMALMDSAIPLSNISCCKNHIIMKTQITEKDMRLPDYAGFWMEFVSEKEIQEKKEN